MNCRHCNNFLTHSFCDLQTCPPSNAMISKEDVNEAELYFPLKVFVCDKCWLVQVDEVEKAEAIFDSDYTYFSSYSTTWLEHAKEYVSYMVNRFSLDQNSYIVEIASNDGYLLQFFKDINIPVIGVEPTSNTAQVAIGKGIDTVVDFFGSKLALTGFPQKADLIIGNNVLAHVPDINDFVKGVKILLSAGGVNTFEFPHLCKLVEFSQFDTIYHEHFSYLSLTSLVKIFGRQGLEIFDVQELNTHGGSLRIFVKHKEDDTKVVLESVLDILKKESDLGVNNLDYYKKFQFKVESIRDNFLSFLLAAKQQSKTVIGYGAAAKGNTLLNYCGIKGTDLIRYVVDKSPHKQKKLLPGSRIPVVSVEEINVTKPDFIIIFPWNLKSEVINQLSYTKSWGAKFVIVIPDLEII
ncbi:class I SAM-dependent methyltransferase [bacterium]|nr:class I SAM-dependent methyltransferase [bacterium]